MHLDWKKLAAALPLAGVLAIALASSGSAAPQGETSAKLPNCVEATNLVSVVDDSGSMAFNDRANGRKQMLEILTDLNRDMTFGAVEFGREARSLFPPTVATNGHLTPPILSGLGFINSDGSGVNGDEGGSTNYNAGFALAALNDPSANARLFLSDGDHNVGTYQNGHQTPLIKTYVVGFGSPTISSTGQALLNKIAIETGGPFLVVNNSLEIMATGLKISNALNCDPPPVERTLQFNAPQSSPFAAEAAAKKKGKKVQSRKVAFRADGGTAQVVISHGTTGSTLNAVQFKQGKRGVRRTVTRGLNYVTAALRGLRKGKVKFNVQAKKLAGPTTALVQITP